MDKLKCLKNERTQVRRIFTKALNEFEENCNDETMNIQDKKASFHKLKDKAERMLKLDQEIRSLMSSDESVGEDDLNTEYDTAESYRDKWLISQSKAEYLLTPQTYGDGSNYSTSEKGELVNLKRNVNLPKLNLIQFDGNVRNWIAFWGQFKKIHNDPDLQTEDKFQYLVQATKIGTSARELIESFPPLGENYIKAIDQLKSRFARDEFLIEVYIRDLLALVLQQATGDVNIPLYKLFDKLETQLRALETLGVTSEKYAAMLYPLVESALPVDTLKAWERIRTSRKVLGLSEGNTQNFITFEINNLQDLLDFLRAEVESEERLTLAQTSFTSNKGNNLIEHNRHSKPKKKEQTLDLKLPTAATILATEKQKGENTCLFCKKSGHSIPDCSGFHKLGYNERKEFVTKKGACFSCLKVGHMTKNCKIFVNCCICQRKHYSVMCKLINQINKHEPELAVKSNSKNENNSEVLTTQSSSTLLQTLLVKVVSRSGKTYLARVLLDSGSQRSYVTKDCVEKLSLNELGEEVINHSLFGGVSIKSTAHKTFLMTLHNPNTEFKITVPVLDQEMICNHVPRLQDANFLSDLSDKGIILTDVGRNVPDIKILLGADVIGELYTGKMESINKGLVAVETYLGWTVMGKHSCQTISNLNNFMLNLFCSERLDLSDLWSLDTIGIKDPVDVKSKSDMEAQTILNFKQTIKTDNIGRYEVCLPWTEGHPELLDNRDLAEKRLLSTSRRLCKINKFNEYNQVFKEWLQDGIIEEVPVTSNSTDGHYLPHHAVIKESSMTTKIRPVFDASAKDRNGICLNTCLEKGPNTVELIPPLVMKFRQNRIGVISDIKKAFLQIGLSTADRDYLKFLWWKDFESKCVTTYRHCRVVFGVKSSPFLLGATILHHLDSIHPEMEDTANRLRTSFYVDNCVTSVSSIEELNRFVRESSTIMMSGQFELRDWCSNVTINETKYGNIYSGEPIVPLLGMQWDTQKDELFCDIESLKYVSDHITKRSLLSIAQRIFDVVGFTCPVTLIPKLLLQESWNQKLSWDEELPHEISCQFFKWMKTLEWLGHCCIPRWLNVSNDHPDETTIHVFCDASKSAYAACVFLRTRSKEKVYIQLVSAKSRIAPLKKITIPRLELLAAVIGCRLYVQTKQALHLNGKVYFWTDSTTVLTWIRLKENWCTFVGNRCKEICQSTDKNDWHHVPGDMNAADLPSRGCGAKTLYESRWWEGPAWLKEDEDKWPQTNSETLDENAFLEKKKCVISNLVAETQSKFTESLQYFSKYSKIVRMIAWIIRFTRNASPNYSSTAGELSLNEINEGEMKLIKCIQGECFQDRNETKINKLAVFIDDKGILRVKTRLILSNDDEYFKNPILLPSNHFIVSSLIMEKHTLHQHAGVQTLNVLLRDQFWIIRGRKTVRNVLSKCIMCKRHKVKAANAPIPPLPLERITDCNAFHTTGIDLAGPLYLSSGTKTWIVLFTCAMYRAIHLELVQSLSTDAFIAALRRFIARRGRPSIIFTDNGTNFVCMNNLFKGLDWKLIKENFDVCQIVWKFNPPSAPWWGGWWERLVRMVKELLRRNLGSSSLNYEELVTLLCDCEYTINSRPLTYLSDDFDSLQPLTPSMFLQPIIKGSVSDLDKIDSSCLNKRIRYLQRVRESLRSRFRKEYLSMLVQKTKCKTQQPTEIRVGDVVLIGDDKTKRINWPLALIIEVYKGKDGLTRVAKLKTAKGELIRPIQLLYPLELRTDEAVQYQRKTTGRKIEIGKETKKKVMPILTSRKGRSIRPPKRLDL